MIRRVTFGYLISWWALVFQATRPTVAYYSKQRILTSPGKSLNVLGFSVKFQGPEKSWKITLVLENHWNYISWPWKVLEYWCIHLHLLQVFNDDPNESQKVLPKIEVDFCCHWQQSWKWVTFCDPWPTWRISQLTFDPHDPWPITQSQTMAWVDHDYSRIMMSSRLLPSLRCNLEFWIWLMQYI